MTSHPSEPGPAGENRDASTGAPTEPLPPHAGAPTKPLPAHGFFAWLRSLGIVRGGDRWVGGVCSGVAARTGLDPVLVRGLFVILALFGVGLLLYGLAWAFLPEPDGRIHAEEAVRGTWTSGTTGALVSTVLGAGSPSIFWADDGLFGGLFWSLFWVAGTGLLIYWLSTRSGRSTASGGTQAKPADLYPPAPGAQTRTGKAGAGAAAGPAAAGPGAPFGPGEPYSLPGDPYGPYGWTGPAPMPRPAVFHPKTSPGGAEVALILGAVLLTAGTILTLDFVSVIDLETPAAVALAAAAVVNGLGIVVLGALGRSSGILGLTAAAALVSAAVTGIGIDNYAHVVVANDADWAPNSSNPAAGGYALAAADGQIDLRYLSDEDYADMEVPISVAASDLTILVPDDIPVVIRADMLMGNVRIDDGVAVTESGSLWRSTDRQLDGTGGPPLVVHVKGVASNVLVTVNESDLDR